MKKRAIQAYIRKRVRQVIAATWTLDESASQLQDMLASAIEQAKYKNLDMSVIQALMDEMKKVRAAHESKMSADKNLLQVINTVWRILDKYDPYIREAPKSTDVDVDLSRHTTMI